MAELDEAAGADLAVGWTDLTDTPDYLAVFSGPFQERLLDLEQATILSGGEIYRSIDLERVDLAGDGIGHLAFAWGEWQTYEVGIALVELPAVSSSLEDHDQIVAGETIGPCIDRASGGDLDGDGREELLLLSTPGTFSIYFVSGSIEGQVSMDDLDGPRIDVDEGYYNYNCERAMDAGKDLNGDGHPDLVVQHRSPDNTSGAEVYLGPFEGVREGPGDFAVVWTDDWTYGPDVGSELILSDDLTGDGSNDFVVGGPNDLDADASFIFVFNGSTMFPDG